MAKQIKNWKEIKNVPNGGIIFYKAQHVEPDINGGDCYVVGLVINSRLPKHMIPLLRRGFLEAVIETYNSPAMEEIRTAGKGYMWTDKPPSSAFLGSLSTTTGKPPASKNVIHVDAPVPEARDLAEKFAVALEERLKE